jgi:D-xylose transport system permease protein
MTTSTAPTTPEAVADEGGLGGELRGYLARLRGGDTGSVPAVLGLVVLVTLFAVLRPDTFASKANFANLLTQSAATMFIAMGLVFVLLLGEIDLSAGFTAGTAAAVVGVLSAQRGLPWPVALGGALLVGAVIGLLIGLLVARLGIPSFVVTLAWFLGLQGVLLLVIGNGGTIRVPDQFIVSLMNDNLSPVTSWVLFALVVAGYAAVTLIGAQRRRAAGLPVVSPTVVFLKIAALAVMLGIATFVLTLERGSAGASSVFIDNGTSGGGSVIGVPKVVPIVIVVVVLLTFVLNRTSFGRHIYAVGGNAEAARRAGINVGQIRITCFVIGSTLAAVGGIMFVSRLSSVSPQTGGSTTLLLAVAAAVIGGTSLFGGKGRVIDAVLGGLVIAVINNGLPLITQEAGVQYIVTALVLLLAASVDAIARRRAAATGR